MLESDGPARANRRDEAAGSEGPSLLQQVGLTYPVRLHLLQCMSHFCHACLRQVLGNLRGSYKVQPAPPSHAQVGGGGQIDHTPLTCFLSRGYTRLDAGCQAHREWAVLLLLPAGLQATLKHYRGILRVQERQDRQKAAVEHKALEQQREATHSHGLWLASSDRRQQQQRRRATSEGSVESEESEESSSYWGEVAAKYGVPPPPDTVFRRGKGSFMKFGIRNSGDPARNAGEPVSCCEGAGACLRRGLPRRPCSLSLFLRQVCEAHGHAGGGVQP